MTAFERRPLFGRRVVVTRPRAQAHALSARLQAEGATPVVVPVIDIVEPVDGGAALRAAAQAVDEFDWVVLTSGNGAERFLAELADARALEGVRVAAIGPGSAAVVEAANLVPDLVPARSVAEELVDCFPRPTPEDRGRVLLARAAVARDTLPSGLREMGWEVEVVDAYRTEAAPVSDDELARAGEADIITFTSSSTVDRYLELAGATLPPTVACIGPVTAATARGHGLAVDVEAVEHTVAGLVEALVDWAR